MSNFGPCSEHQRQPDAIAQRRCRTCQRIKAEGEVVHHLVRAALRRGWSVSVFDSEEWTVKRSTDFAAIAGALFTTDDDRLRFRDKNDEDMGTVWLVYGNAGYEVISDYSERLETFMQEPLDFMQRRTC